ncbi:hypothetical protein GQ55_4G193800 [Panicum hallii var. hallii]|uniref:Uncharacterized protein n=1 Tax=Panicum hallii var. hallii TaxID=1504633 RepID=A0A2T7DZ07_9POAL|nr:hypothetical protein GQ55_4G193800 [Panicum hallii var. hallii]
MGHLPEPPYNREMAAAVESRGREPSRKMQQPCVTLTVPALAAATYSQRLLVDTISPLSWWSGRGLNEFKPSGIHWSSGDQKDGRKRPHP